MPTSDSAAKQAPGMKNDYPAQVYPETYRPPEYLAYLERAVVAIRTVRIVVYAALVGLVLVAAYGFFLIYKLTYDTNRMVDQTVRMTEQMQSMARIMVNIHDSMADMRINVGEMKSAMTSLDKSIRDMDGSIRHMANTVALIQHSTRNLDQSVSPAANVMNSFMPFGRGYPGAPPYAPPVGR